MGTVAEKSDAIVKPIIKRFEGLHEVRSDGLVYPYLCPAGHPTQGYGEVVASLDVPPITREEAERRLDTPLIPRYRALALEASPNLAKYPERLAAITDFCFNLGGARYRASTLRKRINAEDWEGARAEIVKWVYGGGRKLPGLVLRRAVEAELLL